MTGRARSAVRLAALLLVLAAVFVFGFLAGLAGNSRGRPSVMEEAADRIHADAAVGVDRARLEQAAIQGMLSTLDDRYAAYYGAADYAEFQKMIDGRFTGIGVWLARVDGKVEVTSVLPGSPAAQAGLRIGDEVVTVDGRRLGDAPVGKVVSRMRGEVGTAVQIAVRRGRVVRRVTLRRGNLEASDVLVDRPASRVMRIRVAAFTRGVGGEVRDAVARANDERTAGIILDLRGNPGGVLLEGVEVASAFLSDGVVVSYRRRGAPEEVHRVVSGGDTRTPIVVLIDGGTASAGEIVAAALQDRERAVLVGSRSYGKGSVQQPVRLADGTALEFTIARYYTPDGRSLEGVGVRPDIDVEPGASDDVAMRRAVDVLDGVLADVGTPRG